MRDPLAAGPPESFAVATALVVRVPVQVELAAPTSCCASAIFSFFMPDCPVVRGNPSLRQRPGSPDYSSGEAQGIEDSFALGVLAASSAVAGISSIRSVDMPAIHPVTCNEHHHGPPANAICSPRNCFAAFHSQISCGGSSAVSIHSRQFSRPFLNIGSSKSRASQ